MARQNWVVLAGLVLFVIFVSPTFAVEQADKDAILQELSSFVDKNPEILRGVIFSMGDTYLRDNKVDEAIALYQKALKILPDDEDFLNRLAGLYNQKKDYTKAAEIYTKLTKIKPSNVWYFNMLSDAYRNAGNKEQAANIWSELIQSSDNPEAFLQAANFYSSQDNLDKAIEVMEKAVKLAPGNVGYLQNLESFYMRAKKFDEAEKICNKALEVSQDGWVKDWVDSELMNIYQSQDRLQELVERFQSALTETPRDVRAYKRLAVLYQRSNEPEKAIGILEKAVGAGVDDRDVNNRLLDLYESRNIFDKAEAQIKKIIGMAPNDVYLYERLANLLDRAGKQDESKKIWQEFLAKVPGDASAYSRYADKLNAWGKTDEAIEQYKKAQSLDSNNLWYSMRIADILIAEKKFGEAKTVLGKIVEGAKDNWAKQEAQRRLKDIEARMAAGEKPTPPVPAVAVKATPAKVPVAAEAPQTAKEKVTTPGVTKVKAKVEVKKPSAKRSKEKPRKKRGWWHFGR